MSLLSIIKGWFGEAQGSLAHTLFLDSNVYTSLNNVTILTANGTTQIDHVIVSRFGIFVVETKNMKGWIFGDENSPQWTQSVFGKKYRFQNPLRQNYRHTKALSEFLQIDHAKLFSVVMFWGQSEFKTPMPSNVLMGGYSSYIKSKAVPLFSQEQEQAMISAIRSGVLPQTWGTRRQHVADLKTRHGSTTICPKCGRPLALRTAKTGKNAGNQFYGCSGFPACRYVKNVEGLRSS